MNQEPDKDPAPKPRKSNAIASAAHKIAKAIDNAPIVRMDDPNDLNDDGVVIGYAAPMSKSEMAQTLAGTTQGLLETMRNGEKGERFIDFFGDDVLTAQLRAEMINLCVEMLAGIPDDESEAIRNNIVERERIENLKEWLDANGWSRAEQDRVAIGRELERCFQGMPTDIVVRERPLRQGEQGISIEQRIVRLAGKKSAPIQGRPSVSVTGEPLEYLDALRFCFDAKAWSMLLNTAQVEQGGQTDKHETWESNTEGRACPLDQEESKAEGVFDQFKWLRLLVKPRLEHELQRIRRDAEFRQTATPLRSHRAIVVGDRSWSRLPKLAAGMSWAFGGSFVELDGHQFMPASDLPISREGGKYAVPAGFALLPKDYRKPHQMILPLDLTGDDASPPLPMAIASAGQYAISFQASLIGIDIMGVVMSQDFAPAKSSMRELTRRFNPKAPKLKRTHYDTIAKGLAQLNNTHVVLPDGRSYRLFDTMVPWREFSPEQYDMEFSVGFSQSFVSDVLRNTDTPAGRPYRGYFIVDRTGIMGCSGAGVLRSYLRLCAYWNAHFQKLKGRTEPAPQLMRPIPMEHWIMLTNLLTPAAEEYLQTGKRSGGGRNRKHEAVKAAKEAAEELAGEGMAKIVVCNSKEILLHPTEMHTEAWWAARNAQDKMGG